MKLRHWIWRRAVSLQGLLDWEPLRELVSREYTDFLSTRTEARPHPFSLISSAASGAAADDYVSWASLTDRHYTSRHLPAHGSVGAVPALDDAASLFRRKAKLEPDQRSNVLFTFFAQWFTDSIFRTDPSDPRRNTSNHDIDLCQIYGLDADTSRLLRTLRGGRLKSRESADTGEEYPELLCEPGAGGKAVIRSEFQRLPYATSRELLIERVFKRFPHAEERMGHLYAAGLDVGNSSIGYTAISTVFLREHNRLCGELQRAYGWEDDERLFQTARAINTVLLLKILVEDYINHIIGIPLFRIDPGFAERRRWYRPNWMALEFNLLYRWHSLVPSSLALGQQSLEPDQFRYNNALLERAGVDAVIRATAAQPAGRIGLQNTPEFLIPAERASLALGRRFRLQSYNAYRRQFDLEPLGSFTELLPSNAALAGDLEKMYGSIDNLEYVVGVFAEEPQAGLLFGELMSRMVAYDALTQIYSNPLLCKNVFNRATFTAVGLDEIARTTSFQSLVDRNTTGKPAASLRVRRPPVAA